MTQDLPADDVGWFAPCAVALDRENNRLNVACARSHQLAIWDLGAQHLRRRVDLEGEPTGLVLEPKSETLFVTVVSAKTGIEVLDAATGALRARWPAGAGACGPAVDSEAGLLYVCERFENSVGVYDVRTGERIRALPVTREPVAAALSPDRRILAVANLLPSGAATARTVSCQVAFFDTATARLRTNVTLPNGSVSARGIAISPSGRLAAVVHNLARFQVATTQVENGWMNDSALSLIDLRTFTLTASILLDEPRRGAANPWAVDWQGDDQRLCITHSGTHEMSVIEVSPLLARLKAHPEGGLVDELSLLNGLRRRIPLPCNGPRALVLSGDTAYVMGYFSDSLAAVDLGADAPAKSFALATPGPETPERTGERLFHDATLSHEGWQSCASCHPEGRADALNWDLLNDGIGNPKQTKSLLLAHQTPPSMSTGVRATAEKAVRSGLRNILFARRPESEAAAIDAYLKSLEPLPSPHRRNGALSASMQRGRTIFEDPTVGCARCHPAPLFTDLKRYKVGTANPSDGAQEAFDTPTLVETWRTAPYLHDGSQPTLEAVLTDGNLKDHHGHTSQLTPDQIGDLVAYLLSL